jgi:hypothetical protein
MHPLVEKGVQAFQAARYKEAIACYEQAIAEVADDPRLHVLLAGAYHHDLQPERARTHYEVALARSTSEAIRKAAQTGLARLASEPRDLPAPAARPASKRSREAVMACPNCGEAMVKEACVCGLLKSDPQRLGLDLVQAYCERADVIMFVRLGLDTYLIARDRVCYRGAGGQLAAIDPRVIFRPLNGIPMIRQEELRPVSPFQTLWAAYPRPGRAGEPRPFIWEAFLEEVGQKLGVELPMPLAAFDAARFFATHRLLPPSEVSRLQEEAQRQGDTFARGFMRATGMTFDALLLDMQGAETFFRPAHRMSNSLGWDLMADGLLEPDELRGILSRQVDYPKPLMQLILSGTSLTPEEVEPVAEEARRRKVERPIRDRLGEILVRRGVLLRFQLQDALNAQALQPELSLGEHLRAKGVAGEAIDEALHRQRIKDQLRYGGQARLGEILVKRGSINRQHLLDALIAQVDQPLPLGEMLFQLGSVSPEQIYLALSQQEATLDALVESERDMELQEQAASAPALTLSIDLEREKQRIRQLWGGLKTGFKAGVKEVKQALDAAREPDADARRGASDD